LKRNPELLKQCVLDLPLTLIELLVVIAIVGVLIGLLLRPCKEVA